MKVLIVTTILAFVSAVPDLFECPGTAKSDPADISISKCKTLPCPLKRNKITYLEFKFTPARPVRKLTNQVSATIFNIKVPFIGVDNTDACQNIFTVAGDKTECPLTAGQKYVYRNSINVLPVYPQINVDVHWALVDQDQRNALCFEVPARII